MQQHDGSQALSMELERAERAERRGENCKAPKKPLKRYPRRNPDTIIVFCICIEKFLFFSYSSRSLASSLVLPTSCCGIGLVLSKYIENIPFLSSTYSLSFGKDFFTLFKGVDGCLCGSHGSGDNIAGASIRLGSDKGRGGAKGKKRGGDCELHFELN